MLGLTPFYTQILTIKKRLLEINMDKKFADELEKRATSMHISTSKYCKTILTQWIESGKRLKLEER